MNDAELSEKVDAYLDANWESMVEDIATLVRVPSFLEEDKAKEGAPFGPGSQVSFGCARYGCPHGLSNA